MSKTSIVKFRVEFLSRDITHDDRIDQLIHWCMRFSELGLTPAFKGGGRALGNLSFRLWDHRPSFMITASSLPSKKSLVASDFVQVHQSDPVRKVVFASGVKDPSSESMMHYQIYALRSEIGAVFHGHDAEIIDNAVLLGVPQTAKEERPGTTELLNEVVRVLKGENFIVMKNHGFLSLGRTMEEAGTQALQIKKKIAERREV